MNKCEYCGKETSNPKFCSLSCSATIQNRNRPVVPKKTHPCKECGKETSNPKFCDTSCAAKYNNPLKAKDIFCLGCGEILPKGNLKRKYCSNKCQGIYRMNESIKNKTAGSYTTKRFLILEHGEKCMECGWGETNPYSGKVPIELEHIDGNSENNNLDNVKLLCPNCHSLTKTYKALNVGNGRYKRRERFRKGLSY